MVINICFPLPRLHLNVQEASRGLRPLQVGKGQAIADTLQVSLALSSSSNDWALWQNIKYLKKPLSTFFSQPQQFYPTPVVHKQYHLTAYSCQEKHKYTTNKNWKSRINTSLSRRVSWYCPKVLCLSYRGGRNKHWTFIAFPLSLATEKFLPGNREQPYEVTW